MSLAGPSARASLQVSRGVRHSMPGEEAEILEVNEKHGPLYNAIPCMPIGVAIIFCIFNIIVPGLGTLFSAWTCLCGCKTKLGKPAKAFCLNLVSALLQMITFVFIVGWVWSIIWGMNFVQISSESRRAAKYAHPDTDPAAVVAVPASTNSTGHAKSNPPESAKAGDDSLPVAV